MIYCHNYDCSMCALVHKIITVYDRYTHACALHLYCYVTKRGVSGYPRGAPRKHPVVSNIGYYRL